MKIDSATTLHTEHIMYDHRYYALLRILVDALRQASDGKGRERHDTGVHFEDQPIVAECREQGHPGFPIGQARKKLLESVRLAESSPAWAYQEVLGAINYAAAAAIYYRGLAEERKTDAD